MKYMLVLLIYSHMSFAVIKEKLPEQIQMDSESYDLCKQHIIKYAYVLKIAYVGLYLKDCDSNDNILEASDKLIRFHYQVDVKAQVFIEAAESYFLKNTNKTITQEEKVELQRFNQLYENINAYEYYDLLLQQGHRLKLLKNDELLGSSLKQEFAFNYFKIWFGKYPAVKRLKKSFLQ